VPLVRYFLKYSNQQVHNISLKRNRNSNRRGGGMATTMHILYKGRPEALRALCAKHAKATFSQRKQIELASNARRQILLLSVVLWKRLVVVFFSQPPWTVAGRQAALSKLSHKKTPRPTKLARGRRGQLHELGLSCIRRTSCLDGATEHSPRHALALNHLEPRVTRSGAKTRELYKEHVRS
jgi:hypothetical protein